MARKRAIRPPAAGKGTKGEMLEGKQQEDPSKTLRQKRNTLQTQLAKTHRQFQVASTDNAGALPAYRDAVADYFEQVSRDYQPDKNESGDAH